MTPRDDVILSFSNLSEGQTSAGNLCPVCNGGRSRERSLSVGRSNGLWWRCHRASCGWKGGDSYAGTDLAGQDHDTVKERTALYKSIPIPAPLLAELCRKFTVDSETIRHAGWSYTDNYSVRHNDGGLSDYGPRVIMPIFGPAGETRGLLFRSYSGHRKKAIINGTAGGEMMSWYRWRKYARTLCIVEDQPSAIRIAEAGVDSLSLCGTTLNIDRILEIREQGYKSVWIALDNDAFNTAVGFVNKFSRYLPSLRVKHLDMDFKDMPVDSFQLNIQELI